MKKLYLLLIISFFYFSGFSQTVINPIAGGGFDLGNTFALNGWSVVNSSANKWVVGSTIFNSSPNSAYISIDGNPANYSYDNTTAHISHFYQKVTIPVNATNVNLSFVLLGNMQNDSDLNLLDGLEVFTDVSLTAPTADVLPGGSAVLQIFQLNPNSTYVSQTLNINSLAGKTFFIIFTWINNGDGIGDGPPASIDDVSLTYCIKNTNYTVTGGGGYCPGSEGANVGLSGSVVGINYQLYNSGAPVGGPVPGTGSPLNFGPQQAGGPFTVIGTSGACSYNMSGSVSVSQFTPPTASASSNSPVCVGSTLNLSGSGGTSYNWSGPNSFTSTVQDASIPNVTVAAAGTYKVVVTDNHGCKDSTTTPVIINPTNAATLTSAAGTDAQTICFNTPITPITYATTGATGASFSGLPTGVSGSWSGNLLTISGSPTVSGPFPYSISLTGGCPATINGNINVTTNSTIALTSAPGTDDQTKCINSAITNITYATTGATGATATGLPAGVTGIWASNVFTISGTPSAAGTFNYSVSLTGGCGTVNATGTLTVILNNTVTLTSAAGTDAQTKCINSSITDITYTTNGATGATFSGLPPGVTGSWVSNVVTISGTPTSTTGSPYNYTVTLTGGCGMVSTGGTITVNPENTISLTSAPGTDAQTKCINTAIANITYATTGATGATFSGLPPGVNGTWAGNVVTISGTPSTTSGSPFSYTITVTGGCGAITVSGTITVNPNNTISLSSAPGTNTQTKCINTAITDITYNTTGATGATFSGLPAGVNGNWAGNVVTITGTPTSSGTFNYTVTLTGGCSIITASGTLTVTPANTITLTSAAGTDAQTRCFNTAITPITYTFTGATSISFAGLPAGITGGVSGNTITISGASIITGTSNYTITLNGGCGNITANGSITISTDNTITLSSGSGTDVQTKCINTAITDITYTTTGATGATFTNLPNGVTGLFSGNVVTISGTPISATGSPFNYTVTLTGGCGNISAFGTITVNSLAVITLTSTAGTDAQNVCSGNAITTITYAYNNVTGATVTGLPAGLTVIPGIGTITISGTPTQNGIFNYSIQTTGGCGQATITGTINVEPAIGGTVSPTSTCIGNSATLTLSGQSGNIVKWQSSVDGGTTWIDIPGTTSTLTVNNVMLPTLIRAVIGNSCGNVYSVAGQVSIHNYWTGASGTDWNTPGNWSDNQVPSLASCQDVYIPNTTNQPILNGAPVATIGSLTIGAGASLTINGTGLLQLAGTITNNGILNASNGTVEFNGTSPQTIAAATFLNNAIMNLVISNSSASGVSLGGPLDVFGSLSYGPAGTTFVTNDNLTLKSTITQTAWLGNMTGHTITGNVTVERYIATGPAGGVNHGKSWQLLATPTVGQTVKASWQEGATASDYNYNPVPTPDLTKDPHPGYGTMVTSSVANAATQPTPGFDYLTASPSMKAYNYLTGGFDGGPATTAAPIYNQKGWYVYVRGDRSVGTPTAPATPTVLRTKGQLFTPANLPPVTTVTAGNFESIGNPYASAIDVRKITLSGGVDSEYIVWDPRMTGSYGAGAYQYIFKVYPTDPGSDFWVTPGGYSYPSYGTAYNYIQSGQAFLMQATGTNGTVTFTEDAKASANPSLFTTPNGVPPALSILRITLNSVNPDGTAGNLLDGTVIGFSSGYSNGIDGLDARKLVNSAENLSINVSGHLLAIERRQPLTTKDTIFLNLTGAKAQPYLFHLDAQNIDPTLQGFLVDNYLNTQTPVNLAGSTDINFSVTNIAGSYAANRFMIVFAPQVALPVTFTSIKAYPQDKNIEVEWKVANERNISQYVVEKSTDGNLFTGLANQAPTNNNGGAASYTIADKQPVDGYNYYRVKSIDVNGNISYTGIVKVLIGSIQQEITIYPNPITDGMIHLQLINQPEGRYKLSLYNKLGQLIIRKQISHPGGNSTQLLQWDYNLAHGMYQLEVTKPDGSVKDINVLY